MEDDIDLNELAQLRKLQALMTDINADPTARRHLERAIKVKVPDIQTLDDQEALAQELAKPHLEKVEAMTNKLEKLLESEENRRVEATKRDQELTITQAFNRLRQTRGFTDEGVDAVKKLMIERNIADPEAAAALFNEMQPKEIVNTWQSAYADPTKGSDKHDLLLRDEDRWADEMTGNILREMRAA